MKIKMLTLMSGPDGTMHPGSVISVPNEKGKELISGKFAELVDAEVEPKEEPEKRQVKKDGENTNTKPKE